LKSYYTKEIKRGKIYFRWRTHDKNTLNPISHHLEEVKSKAHFVGQKVRAGQKAGMNFMLWYV
jgi:hypothetical protein